MFSLNPDKPALLIVDDDEDQLALLRMAAERSNAFCKVAVAEDGVRALEDVFSLIDNLPTATRIIVLADLKMPGMDGTELARRLRPACDALPIWLIGMSSSGYGPNIQAALDAGCMAFIEKPSGYLTLKSLMASLLQICSTRDPSEGRDVAFNAIFAHS
ncbi:MAG TPA: response regulator [Opitutaceae bacterium]